jgi:hypothetical protein
VLVAKGVAVDKGEAVEWAKLVATVLTAFGAAGWAIVKWTDQREKDRQNEENRLAALYLNPFLSACDALQSRLYNILCRAGLSALRRPADREVAFRRKVHPESKDAERTDSEWADYRHAEETLFLIAEYFAYERFILRYTPYGTDPQVLDLIWKVRDAFASDKGGADAWCIFRPRQNALGRLVVASREGEHGAEVDTISLLKFKKVLVDEGAAKSLYLEQALFEMNKAKFVSSLDGRTRLRLAQVQSHLIDLLEYLEGKLRNLEKRKSEKVEPASGVQRRSSERAYDSTCPTCQHVERELLQNMSTPSAPICHRHHKRMILAQSRPT